MPASFSIITEARVWGHFLGTNARRTEKDRSLMEIESSIIERAIAEHLVVIEKISVGSGRLLSTWQEK